ncbi:MAG TPA: hypothetical protein VFH45_11895 [Acidimicrobiales bacterium]|nr:hypothetical protein [Acidimicrobiales bacterium]
MPDADPIEFECPRCHSPARAATYGPCPSCRAELVAAFAGEARAIEVERYEPKMNVVPNQVATKE